MLNDSITRVLGEMKEGLCRLPYRNRCLTKTRLFAATFVLFLCTAIAHAQQTGVNGHVLDASGAAIPNALITVPPRTGLPSTPSRIRAANFKFRRSAPTTIRFESTLTGLRRLSRS